MAAIDWKTIRHFKRSEFRHDPDQVAPALVYTLDEIRAQAKAPMIIHVAWASSGHSPRSFHYKGLACDFHFGGSLQSFRNQFTLLAGFKSLGGIGFYPFWNSPGWHVDLRQPPRVYWFRDRAGHYHYGLPKLMAAIEEAMRARDLA